MHFLKLSLLFENNDPKNKRPYHLFLIIATKTHSYNHSHLRMKGIARNENAVMVNDLDDEGTQIIPFS
jgi:hypothetical protein